MIEASCVVWAKYAVVLNSIENRLVLKSYDFSLIKAALYPALLRIKHTTKKNSTPNRAFSPQIFLNLKSSIF